jgi:hypothetical protein
MRLNKPPHHRKIAQLSTQKINKSIIGNFDNFELNFGIEYGYSLDKRMSKRTLPIYTDLDKTSYAFAQALLRHIKFSRGLLFLEDLAEKRDQLSPDTNNIVNKIELTPSQGVLRFNYCFN